MTNEELVARIQAGEHSLINDLWNQVESLVAWKARYTILRLGGMYGVSFDDLYNTGFLALVDSIVTFHDTGFAFTTWFMFYLKTAFAKAAGYRNKKSRNDPLQNAVSLSSPIGDDESASTLSDITPDPDSERLIEAVEEKIWKEQLHNTMLEILHELPEDQSSIIKRRYYEGQTLNIAAQELGKTAAEVRSLEIKGLHSLRQPKHAKRLRPFYDFNYYYGTGLQNYLHTGTSIQERYLIKTEELNEMKKE